MNIHWADVVALSLLDKGPQTVASGITPSGHIHIGNMREVVTADAIYRALLDRGVNARLLYIADTYDPLRRVYPFLPGEYREHVGRPLSEIPCPEGCCSSYADHFLTPFLDSLEKLGIRPEIYRADRLYKDGMYVDAIKKSMLKREEIARILRDVSGREVSSDWSPFDSLCQQCGRLSSTKVVGFDIDRETVDYECTCGFKGVASMRGGGKLAWRVDWPARWPILGITVEPFGKDHATAGGSYDTGKRISEEVFCYPPPHPVIYEWIHLKGKGAMSSSKGVVVPIKDMLDVVPPEVLRYLIIRSKPEKHIEFDPGMPLLTLVEEYDRRAGEERAFEISAIGKDVPFEIPFGHMLTAVQIARGDRQKLIEVLKRGGYDLSNQDAIFRRASNAEAWLEKYAPTFVKFQLKEELPPAVNNLGAEERRGLWLLSERISDLSALDIHNEVYTIAEEVGIDSKALFKAIYVAFLGQKNGPKAGWFLAGLDRDFVERRLREAAFGLHAS